MRPSAGVSPVQQERIDRWAGERGFRLVVLFGSRARGQARRDSDFDVAVWPTMPQHPLDRLSWIAELEEILGAAVQVVAVSPRTDPVLGWEIGRDGEPLVESASGEWTRERLRLWHLYNDSLPFRRLQRRKLAEFAAGVRGGA